MIVLGPSGDGLVDLGVQGGGGALCQVLGQLLIVVHQRLKICHGSTGDKKG